MCESDSIVRITHPDIESGDTKFYFVEDYIYVYTIYKDLPIFNRISVYNITTVYCSGDDLIALTMRKKPRDLYFPVNPQERERVIKEIFAKMLLYDIKNKKKKKSLVLKDISDNLYNFVESVSVSIGSDEYNQAKSHFENSIK